MHRPTIRRIALCAGVCALAWAGSARGQTAPADSGRASAAGLRRPTFVLPDVVIEGEDLSRLAGGRRRLELGSPGVAPQQAPARVGPGPSAFAPHWEMPFTVRAPRRVVSPAPNGLLRATVASPVGGALELAYLPAARGPLLWWGAGEVWRGRWTDTRRWSARAGVVALRPALDPGRKLALGVGASGSSWDAVRGGVSPPGLDEGRQRIAGFHAQGAQRVAWFARDAVFTLRGRTARAVTTWSAADVSVERAASWAHLEAAWRSPVPTPPPGEARARTDWVGQVRAGLARRAAPAGEAATDWRADVLAGYERASAGRSLGAGLVAAGDAEAGVLAPYLAFAARWDERPLAVRVELAPRVVHADEVLLAEEDLAPGGAEPDHLLTDPLETLAAVGVGPDLVARPRLERTGVGRSLPRGALVDPRLPAQVAWPRLVAELVLRGEGGHVRVSALAAEIESPLGWEPVDSVAAAGGSVLGAGSYRLTTRSDRSLLGLRAEGAWRWSPRLELRAFVAWSRDERGDGREALPFVPAREARFALGGARGDLDWEAALHARAQTPAGDGRPDLEGFVDVSAGCGWRRGGGRYVLLIENLLGDRVERRPGDGLPEIGLRIGYEHSFYRAAP